MKQSKVADFKNCANFNKNRKLTVCLLQKRTFQFQCNTVDICDPLRDACNYTKSNTPLWVFFHVFKIVQIVPNRAKLHIYLLERYFMLSGR